MNTITFLQMNTRPSHTCSEGYTFMLLLLRNTGSFLCAWEVLTGLVVSNKK